MPVYNNEQYILDAVESILNQSYQNYEFIIIDDASTDKSSSIIENYCSNKKIILLKNQFNRGISYCLNIGMQLAKGDYIVRMDSDDISVTNRLETQVAFMESCPEIGISGSSTEIINEKSEIIGTRHVFTNDQQIKIALLLGETSLAHSSIIMRKDFIYTYALFYNPAYDLAEDYELFCRGSNLGKYQNIDDFLLKYRVHSQSVSCSYKIEQTKCARHILRKYLLKNRVPCSEKEMNCHMQLSLPLNEKLEPAFLQEIYQWKEKLKKVQRKIFHFNEDIFSEEIDKRYQNILLRQ